MRFCSCSLEVKQDGLYELKLTTRRYSFWVVCCIAETLLWGGIIAVRVSMLHLSGIEVSENVPRFQVLHLCHIDGALMGECIQNMP